MIADTTAPSQGQDLQASTESAYDATVRADIELFRSYAAKFMAGQLSVDDFRAQRLRRGVYTQRQDGVHMIRTKVPGGLLTAAASSSRTAASCISQLTLPTLNGQSRCTLSLAEN